MKLKSCTKKPEELTPGLAIGRVSFKFTLYDNRAGTDKIRYDLLKKDLIKNGMRNPLIIWQGHVLVGMRRYDILKDIVEEFECLEVQEDISKWSSSSVLNLIKVVNLEYRERERDRAA